MMFSLFFSGYLHHPLQITSRVLPYIQRVVWVLTAFYLWLGDFWSGSEVGYLL